MGLSRFAGTASSRLTRLGGALVALDPADQTGERGRFEVDPTPLGIGSDADEAGDLEDTDVLRDRLQGDVIRGSEFTDGGITEGESGDDVSSRPIGQRRERPVNSCPAIEPLVNQ